MTSTDDSSRRCALESLQKDRSQEASEEHRQHITRWFYDCGYDIHGGLAEMYVEDQRFKANYDNIAEGLATYVHDAIGANAPSPE